MTNTFSTNEFCGGRIDAVRALTGSHNYNINTPESDRDYKFFVYPTFDDLYHEKMYSNYLVSLTLDATCHDVRQLIDLVWKSNINYIEVLYSKELYYRPELAFLFENPETYTTMNLFGFYKATYGMHLMKMKDLFKGTGNTTHLVEKFGYDTKQACHALRCLYVINRYMTMDNIGKALWFTDDSYERKTLLDIKNGLYTVDEFQSHVDAWHESWKTEAELFYKSIPENKPMYEYAKDKIKELVKTNLFP